jgi:uncharacterized protein with HEPN domain
MPYMPSRSPLHILFDIRDNAILARNWAEGQTLESFKENLLIFYGVTRCLEIVSEASRRLPEAIRESHPELPWRAIMDVGNVYRHQYDNVSEDAVWRTVEQRLPELITVVEAEIAKLSDDGKAKS